MLSINNESEGGANLESKGKNGGTIGKEGKQKRNSAIRGSKFGTNDIEKLRSNILRRNKRRQSMIRTREPNGSIKGRNLALKNYAKMTVKILGNHNNS